MSTKKINTINEETVKEEPVVEKKAKPAKPVTATVANCTKLNLRADARADAPIIKILNAGDKLTLDTTFDSQSFYKVTTADGTVGFVMKPFISK